MLLYFIGLAITWIFAAVLIKKFKSGHATDDNISFILLAAVFWPVFWAGLIILAPLALTIMYLSKK